MNSSTLNLTTGNVPDLRDEVRVFILLARWLATMEAIDVPAHLRELVAEAGAESVSVAPYLTGGESFRLKHLYEFPRCLHSVSILPCSDDASVIPSANCQNVFVSSRGEVTECYDLTVCVRLRLCV